VQAHVTRGLDLRSQLPFISGDAGDLTSAYYESDPPLDENDKRGHGYSHDHRFDCVQIVIALIVIPEVKLLPEDSGNPSRACARCRH
jgi:hypothetical protein